MIGNADRRAGGRDGGRKEAKLDWRTEGPTWPHHAASRFVRVGGFQWHVQLIGSAVGRAPAVLLVHGTGASTHSWRDVASALAGEFTVVAVDLPGHGFTDMPPPAQLSLPAMAQALHALLVQLDIAPVVAVGHSAGAAIIMRMSIDGCLPGAKLVSINGAVLPFGGLPGQLFAPAARLLAATPWVTQLFTWRASDPAVLRKLVDSTGSRLSPEGIALYGRLVRSPGHAAGALGMMSRWDLVPLERDLSRLTAPLLLVVASNDRTVLPSQGRRVQQRLPGAQLTVLDGLGHLAHEEQPEAVAALIRQWAAR